MNTTPLTPHRDRTVRLQLAAAIAVFLVAATLPYIWLIDHFGYDDILREPAADILARFHAGGGPLVLAWFGFAVSALLFVPIALGFDRLLAAHGSPQHAATMLGIGSAIAQAVGLLRWVLVVPALATAFVAPQTGESTRQALLVAFDAVHRYGGMVIGEMVGQLLLAGWTGLTAMSLWQTRAVPRWLAAMGLLSLPLWLAGQTELLHLVVPAVPSIEVIPWAFMGWEAWLAAVCMALVVSGLKPSRLTLRPAPYQVR